jgi:small-conductance mechanosensitive channel
MLAMSARRFGTGRVRWRSLACAGCVIALLMSAAASGAVVAATPAPLATTQAPPAVSAEEVQHLVETLQDDKARAQLIEELQALIAAQRQQEQKAPATPAALFDELAARFDQLAGEVLAASAVLAEAPRLVGWVQAQIADSAARERWLHFAAACGIVFGAGFAVERLVRLGLARLLPRRRRRRRRDGFAVRTLLAAVAILVGILPIAGFAATAELVLPMTLELLTTSRIALGIVVEATISARLILALAKAALFPAYAEAAHASTRDETRAYLNIWIRRFTCWAIFGYAVPKGAWWLGAPGGIYALMLDAVGLVLAVLAIVFVLQNRRTARDWIAGPPPAAGDGAARGWRGMRRRSGETWHVLALVYIVGIYLVYALRIEGGFVYVLRATVLSVAIFVVARLIVGSLRRVSAHGFAVAPDLRARFPGLEERANRYLPILTGLFGAAIYAAALLAMLEAWNVRSFAWMNSEFGRRLTGAALSIAAVVGLAVAIWEVIAAAIERQLNGAGGEGASGRSRRRTLLPLVRTALLYVIVVIAGLTILAQLGINIAPLLAGAGIVGIAIGFGSQALVKDIITGLFILVEDQIAVGDIVDVGKDHSGTVEAMSVRTIRLRDQAGVVHTVPFGEITTVKNLTRDFAHVVARITISYREDIDRVVEVLRGVSEELTADDEMRPLILDPFDYLGVDSLDPSGVVLLLRIRTLPMKQWTVGRAFNRLVKIAFDKHGIAMRDPSAVMVTGLAAPETAEPGEAPRRHRA